MSIRNVAHIDDGGHVIFDDAEAGLSLILRAYKRGVSWMIYSPAYWDELDQIFAKEFSL